MIGEKRWKLRLAKVDNLPKYHRLLEESTEKPYLRRKDKKSKSALIKPKTKPRHY